MYLIANSIAHSIAPTPANSTIRLQPADQEIELIEVAVDDVHGAGDAERVDPHVEPEGVGQALFQRLDVGALGWAVRHGCRLLHRLADGAYHVFGLANVEAVRNDVVRRAVGIG